MIKTKLALSLVFLATAAGLARAASVPGAITAKRETASPCLQQLFDNRWRFYRGDAPDAAGERLDDSSWRTVDRSHDWSIEDLPPLPEGSLRLKTVSPREGSEIRLLGFPDPLK